MRKFTFPAKALSRKLSARVRAMTVGVRGCSLPPCHPERSGERDVSRAVERVSENDTFFVISTEGRSNCD